MRRDEVFPSKYLKATDLKTPITVTIESAPYETLKSLDGKETHKIVLHFRGTDKTLPLNATNWDSVCEVTNCPDTDDWPGKQIELFPAKTTMGGKSMDCIRIREPKRVKLSQAQTEELSARAPFRDDDMDEEIPF